MDAWTGVGNAEIVALTDRHPERRTPVVEKYSIPLAFNDFEQMLEGAELDFVDICSWASVPIPYLDRPNFKRRWHHRQLEIEGTRGTLVLRPDTSIDFYSDNDEQHWLPAETGMAEAHTAAQQHFINCLESGAEFETSAEETLKTMALVYACYQSAVEGGVVDPGSLLLESQTAD